MYQTESALVQACLKGNRSAWNEMVERYGRLVYSIPCRHGLSAEDADEVFQNVFAIVLRQLPQLRNPAAIAGWLITIAHRESILVSRKFRLHPELSDETEDIKSPPIESLQRWERQHYVRVALQRLESPCRELITILFLEDPVPSYDEVAKRLRVPIGSIGPNRGRCLKKLEVILAEMDVDLSS